jgi:hypothetical protein
MEAHLSNAGAEPRQRDFAIGNRLLRALDDQSDALCLVQRHAAKRP